MNWIERNRRRVLEAKIKNPVLLEIIFVAITMVSTVGLMFITFFLNIPHPVMLLVTLIVLFTSLFGYISGGVATILTVAYGLYYFTFLHNGAKYDFSSENIISFIVCTIGCISIYTITALLKRNQDVFTIKLAKINAFLEADNAKLEEISTSDSLTRTKNRFALRKDFEKYVGTYAHVMMYDIDNFKIINDTLGHAAGDYVLKKTGAITKQIFGTENCYRYGGDEFVIIVQDMGEEEFSSKVKDLKQAINEIYLKEQHIPVHYSGGYVDGDVDTIQDLRKMIRQADELLYKAKRAGKDDTKHAKYQRKEN